MVLSRGWSGRALVLSMLVAATGANAQIAPPPVEGKNATPKMLDARVNLKQSYFNALEARADSAQQGRQAAAQHASEITAAINNARVGMPGLDVDRSGLTAGPTSVRNARGTLTTATGQSNQTAVRNFLSARGAIYGLNAADINDVVTLGDSQGSGNGLRMLRVEQVIANRAVFQSETRFTLDRQGRVVKSVGIMVPHARTIAPSLANATLLDARTALSRLLAFEDRNVDLSALQPTAGQNGRTLLVGDADYVAGEVTAREVWFPLAPGVLVPAWSLVVFTEGDADWYAVVDAQTGDVLWRKNMRNYASTHDARFRVFVQADGVTPADSPAPQSPNTAAPGAGTQFPGIAPTIVSMHTAMNATASPNGWIDDCPGGVCTANETQTLGNNVLACLDRTTTAGNANICDTNAAGVIDGNGRPTGNPDANARNRDFLGTAPRDFQTNFLPSPQAGNPEAGQTATGVGASGTNALDQFRRGSITSQFYVTNWYHDKLYALGFDEGSANFQQINFSGMGVGSDRVLVDVQDGTSTNNANFATPPDGTSGRAQMYRFDGPTIDRDGGLDNEILLHELTHGTSNRLVGNGAGLNWEPAGGLGEGWSDFYALSLLNNTNADTPTAQFASGGYATYKLAGLPYLDNYVYGIRRFPYSTNNSVNPMTWADVDDVTNNLAGGIAPTTVTFNNGGGSEVHNSGEIWALTLWEVRSRVIADPAGANGDVPTGNNRTLQIVTDAMKMTPIDPTFTAARDALIEADCATNACANETSIWGGFADRGLGYDAYTPYNVAFGFIASHMGIRESFSVPFLDVVDVDTDVTINDSAANNNGTIDPGEPVNLTIKLTNPWSAASRAVANATATLTTSTPGVTIIDGTSTYGAIAPQGSATGDTFTILLNGSVLCGSRIDFTLSTTSSLGTTSDTFSLRVGDAAGTAPVVTYTQDTTPDLAIVDNRGRAVFDTLSITDDFVIADLDLRLDSITHTFSGDVTAMLRSPGAIGVDQMALIGGLLSGGGAGDNFANMVMDDDLASSAAVDMVQAPNSAAPFTTSWLPVFNAPWPSLAAFPPADPIGTFSRLDGTSTLGNWTLAVSDGAAGDTGTLNSWSILVTPVQFSCTAFVGQTTIAATKTVAGTFSVGGTVTYTITLTNSGTLSQADNAGNEFTDVLPAGLTLVSATATSGTAATAGNTATWNGGLALLGGSTTITITATVNAGSQGTTISNQGTASYDADGNGSNEATVLTDDPGVGGTTDPTLFSVAGSLVSGTKTVSGTFSSGGTVTYTITLNNAGNTAAPDNAGNELSDVLSASLTLVSATSSSGTATTAGNTVSWNGSIPAAGSVTITITATVNAVPFGTSISNQGAISYDSDLNGSNETTTMTDDPGVGGAADATVFIVGGSVVSGTKSVAGTFSAGGTVTYTVTLNNSGNAATADNAGDEFSDVLPSSLTLVSAVASSGTATVAGNTATWNGAIASAGSVTITITATVNAVPFGTSISNQGTISYDADLNGSNESTALTDDPGVGGASDPTVFSTVGTLVTGTKSVSGAFSINNAITYTIVLTNSGNTATLDNPGNELTDVLPSQLTLVSASASSGTAVATIGTNTVAWNGSIAAGGSVTITINANIDADAGGQVVSNQAQFAFDANVDGSNESTGVTDDTALGGATDPTVFTVAAGVQIPVPLASNWTLAMLALGMLIVGGLLQRRRVGGF